MRWTHLAALLASLTLVAVLVALGASPPAVVAASAPDATFSAERAMIDVRGLTSTGLPHPVGSADHERARRYVEDRLRALGLEPRVARANACRGKRCADIENVVATIEGTTPGPALMLAAHYDSVATGPGASDDGAGVATVLEVVRALRAGPPPARTIVVLIDDGEELGLLGARAFVEGDPLAKDVAVVLNFEARGTAGQTSMFETSAKSAWLVEAYAGAVERPVASSVIYALYKRLPNDTDLTVFKEAGMRGLNFAFADRVWHYHTPNDTADMLDPRSLQHMGDQALAVTRALLAEDLAQPEAKDAVYFDLFSLALVTYRTTWVAPLALAGALVSAAGLALAVRRKRTTPGAVLRGLGVALLALVAAGVAGAVVSATIGAVIGGISPWASGPVAPWSAMVAAGVAASAAVLTRLGPRAAKGGPADAIGAMGGAVALWTALSLLLAWKEGGASYLFTLPSIALGVGLVVAARSDAPRATAAATIGASLVVGLLWFPILRVLLVMVGAGASPAASVPAAIIVTAGAPVAASLAGRARWSLPLGALAVCVVATALAMARVGA